MEMSQSLAQISDLNVQYVSGKGIPVCALQGVSLRINAGEVTGVLGESGSGKSTLGLAVTQLLLPANAECQGSILFEGQEMISRKDRELRRILGKRLSLIPQDPATALNPVMRAGVQVSEVLRAHLKLKPKERRNRVLELLHEVGFDHPDKIASAYPHQLSGGQRQRVVIAQAIACHPALIIADEPTSKLDLPLQMQILELMSGVVQKSGAALLWITHDPTTLAGFADRVVVMRAGQVVESGSTNEVFRQPKHPYTQKLVGLAKEFTSLADRGLSTAEYVN